MSFTTPEINEDSVLFSSKGKHYSHKMLKEASSKISEAEGDILAVIGDPNDPNMFMNGTFV